MKKICIILFSILSIVIVSTLSSCKKEEKLLPVVPITTTSFSIDSIEGYWERCIPSPTGQQCFQEKWQNNMIYEPIIAGDTSQWGFSNEYYLFNRVTDSLFISDNSDMSYPDKYKVIRADSSLWIVKGIDTVRYHRL